MSDVTRQGLQSAADRDFWLLIGSTILVIVGVILEVPESWSELQQWRRARSAQFMVPEHRATWHVPAAAIGLLLVIVGVAGEGVSEAMLGMADGNLRTFDENALARNGTAAASALDRAAEALRQASALQQRTQDLATQQGAASDLASRLDRQLTLQKQIQAEQNQEIAGQQQQLQSQKRRADILSDSTSRKALTSDIRPFSSQPFDLVSCRRDDSETADFVSTLQLVLSGAGWRPFLNQHDDPYCVPGLRVYVHKDSSARTAAAAAAMLGAFTKMGLALGDSTVIVTQPFIVNPIHRGGWAFNGSGPEAIFIDIGPRQ